MKVPSNYIIFNSVVVIGVFAVAYLICSTPLSSLPPDMAVSIMIGTLGLMVLCVIVLDLMILPEIIERLLRPNNPMQLPTALTSGDNASGTDVTDTEGTIHENN